MSIHLAIATTAETAATLARLYPPVLRSDQKARAIDNAALNVELARLSPIEQIIVELVADDATVGPLTFRRSTLGRVHVTDGTVEHTLDDASITVRHVDKHVELHFPGCIFYDTPGARIDGATLTRIPSPS